MSSAGDKSAAQQQAEDACATMQAALAALTDGSDASCPQPSRQQVQAAVQLLRMEVAKMGLVYRGTGGSTGSGAPSEAELTALLSGFQQAACTLCMLYSGIAAAGGEGFDLVVDSIGGSYERASLRLLKPGGRLSALGATGPGVDRVSYWGMAALLLNAFKRTMLGRLRLAPKYTL